MEIPAAQAIFNHRRKEFIEILKDENPEVDNGLLMLIGNFENDRHVFRQESSFYYLTGITEPGSMLFSYFDGREILYIPAYATNRENWVNVTIKVDKDTADKFGVDEVRHLGLPTRGYSISPLLDQNVYLNILNDLNAFLNKGNVKIFTFQDKSSPIYLSQLQTLDYLKGQLPKLSNATEDCSYIVHELRRFKDDYEIDCLHKAAQITELAHFTAASTIAAGKREYEIQAMIESVFTVTGASHPAFPSIVAGGKNATVLHYMNRDEELKDGDLVVVDIGAEFMYYAADITRTYPVSGKFTDRQREVYNVVLRAQTYIETIAAPGMYLNNPQKPEKSLQHLAVEFLKKEGYSKYFIHGIGHYLGLDVHDVGDTVLPLEEGHVITIEPGIYIPEENLGIRIEDDYVIVDGGCVQLDQELPKTADEIESIMAKV